MFIFPPIVTSPVKLESPLISTLPKEAVPVPVMLFIVVLSKAPLIWISSVIDPEPTNILSISNTSKLPPPPPDNNNTSPLVADDFKIVPIIWISAPGVCKADDVISFSPKNTLLPTENPDVFISAPLCKPLKVILPLSLCSKDCRVNPTAGCFPVVALAKLIPYTSSATYEDIITGLLAFIVPPEMFLPIIVVLSA